MPRIRLSSLVDWQNRGIQQQQKVNRTAAERYNAAYVTHRVVVSRG